MSHSLQLCSYGCLMTLLCFYYQELKGTRKKEVEVCYAHFFGCLRSLLPTLRNCRGHMKKSSRYTYTANLLSNKSFVHSQELKETHEKKISRLEVHTSAHALVYCLFGCMPNKCIAHSQELIGTHGEEISKLDVCHMHYSYLQKYTDHACMKIIS